MARWAWRTTPQWATLPQRCAHTLRGWAGATEIDEYFTDAELLAAFDLSGINKSPARFDFKKLESICGRHIAAADDTALLAEVENWRAACGEAPLSAPQHDALATAMPLLKDRAKTLPDLVDKGHFALAARPVMPDDKADKALDPVSRRILGELTPHLQTASWQRSELEATVTAFASARDLKLGKIAQPLRAALSGRTATPSVFDMMVVIGRDETLGRLNDAATDGGA